MRMTSILTPLALFAAAPALAQTPASPAMTPARPARTEPVIVTGERLICRPVARTGTRLALSSRCLSRSEWIQARSSVATHEYRSIEEAAAALAIIGNASTTGCGSTPP